MSLLKVEGLTLLGQGGRRILDRVSIEVEEGETLGVVGPSGSGKSSLAWALGRMLPRGTRMEAQRLDVDGVDVLRLDRTELRRFRSRDLAVVPQDPLRALNPSSRIHVHVAEALGPLASRVAVLASLAAVGFAEPERIAQRFPHQVSGGQAQRVLIAMALARAPRVLVLDEPTSALDEAARQDSFAAVRRFQQSSRCAVILISHDHRLIAAHAHRVATFDGGRTVVGVPPPLAREPSVDAGDSTLSYATPGRLIAQSDAGSEALVDVSELYVDRAGRRILTDISLRIRAGEIVGLTGASGSGKTTLAHAIAGLLPHGGRALIRAPDRPPPVQIVWQSPARSLNPRRTVGHTLRRSVTLLGGDRAVGELLDMVGLAPDLASRFPHELSGGEQQRVALARAFAGDASLVICDEPTSSLDPRARDAVLRAVEDLTTQTGAACLFISHDRATLRRVAHRIVCLRDGRLVNPCRTVDGTRG